MDYLRKVIRRIIKESVEQDYIIDAIKKHYEVAINYSGRDGKGTGTRIIQPVAYGTSHSGNPVVRAYQTYGSTATRVPHWKMFRLDKIDSWRPLKNRRFDEPPMKQFGTTGGFNPNGDGKMGEVFVSSNFDDSAYQKSGLKTYNDMRHEKAVERDPYFELRKNIRKSIDGMQFDYIRKNLTDTTKNKSRGNQSSIDDMSNTDSFNTGNSSETVGPIMKNSSDYEGTNTSTDDKPNYRYAMNNGPVFKDDIDDNDQE